MMKLYLYKKSYSKEAKIVRCERVNEHQCKITWPEALNGKINYADRFTLIPNPYQSMAPEMLISIIGDVEAACRGVPDKFLQTKILKTASDSPCDLYKQNILSNDISSLSPIGIEIVLNDIQKRAEKNPLQVRNYRIAALLFESLLRLSKLSIKPVTSSSPISSKLVQNLVHWFNQNKISFSQVRVVAKNVLFNTSQDSVNKKQKSMLEALRCITDDEIPHLTLLSAALSVLEVVMLSTYYSNLGELDVFCRTVVEHNNHSWLLEGARRVISQRFPEAPIQYITLNSGNIDYDALLNVAKSNFRSWIVVSYAKSYHMSLVRLQISGDELLFQLYDSIGIYPKLSDGDNSINNYCKQLHYFIRALDDHANDYHLIVRYTPFYRQADEVNCFSYVLFDLETDMMIHESRLIKKITDKPGYSLLETDLPSQFHAISQNKKIIPAQYTDQWTCTRDTKSNTRVNPVALKTSAKALINLIESNQVTFYKVDEPYDQANDIEDEDSTCLVM